MNSRQKILDVLKRIKSESEINARPGRVRFDFNRHVVGAGFLSADEEARILSKLQKDKWIRLHLPTDEEGIVTTDTPEDHMANRNHVLIDLLPGFRIRYRRYRLFSFFTENKWNYVNPFWWLWTIASTAWGFLGSLVRYTLKHWLVSLISSVALLLGILTINYALVRENSLAIIEFFTNL